jgi:hypothetical protein
MTSCQGHGLAILLQLAFSQPTLYLSMLLTNVQLVVDCLHTMSLTQHTFNKFWNLDYDEIIIQNAFFLVMTFNGDILFKLPPMSKVIIIHHKCKAWT